MTAHRSCVATFFLACLSGAITLHAETANLLSNGNFEAPGEPDGVPSGWTSHVPAGKATFSVSTEQPHGGRQCLVLETPSDMKALLVSEPVAVSPGEKLSLWAWCRGKSLDSQSSGTLALNAGFQDKHHRYIGWAKSHPALSKMGAWKQLKLSAEVPPGAAYVCLQFGHDRMTGQTHWDDVNLRTATPLGIRFAFEGNQLEPGPQKLPLILINHELARAGNLIEVIVEPGPHKTVLSLPAAHESELNMPVDFKDRGPLPLKVRAIVSGRLLATAYRDIIIPPMLVAEPLVPTHWCAEDGPPRIEGRAWVHTDAEHRKKLELRCSLVRDKQVIAETRVQDLSSSPVSYSLTPKAEIGDYTLELTLHESDKVVGEAKQDWHVISRSASEVRVGPDGYLVVEGRPFFPIGMLNGSNFAEQAAAGFNVAHANFMLAAPTGDAPHYQRIKNLLDESQQAGMKTLLLLNHGLGEDHNLGDDMLRRVRMFRNHPALLAWDEEEGVARGQVPLAYLRDLRDLLKREAPQHPLMVGDTCDVLHKVDCARLFPDEHMDLGMWGWYPFPLGLHETPDTTQPAADLGDGTSATTELVPPKFLMQATTTKPIWARLQAFCKPVARDCRFPTAAEYRAQAYLAIIHGAKGLMYDVGSGAKGVLDKPQEGHWEELKKLVSELRDMAGVFTSADSPSQASVTPASISLRLKAGPNGVVLLAAHRGSTPVDATISVPADAVPAGSVEVRYENRDIPCTEGRFTDRFEPLAVHIYEWSAK